MSEIHLQTGAYALDALEDLERIGFERHLPVCDSCQVETAEFREAAARLADRVARRPPAQLRERVMAEVALTRQVSPARAGRRPFRMRRGLAAAAAAVVLAAGAGLGGVAWQAHRSAHSAQVEAAGVARVLTDPARREVAATASVGGSATLVTAGGSAVFTADRLPAPAAGRAYQLWLTGPDGVTTSAGLLHLSGGGVQSVVPGVSAGAEVTVSIEPSGGSKQPTAPAILALKVA